MSDAEAKSHIVLNPRSQPVELHIGGRIHVLPPRGRMEIDEKDLKEPQVDVLRKRRLISVRPRVQKVNVNTASEAQLDALPHIKPAVAKRLVEYRSRHGAFRRIDDLQNVAGIGAATLKKLEDLITV